MEQILTEVIGVGSAAKTKIVGIEFADMTNKENTYLVRVKDGKLDVHDYRLDQNNLAGNAQTLGTGIYYIKENEFKEKAKKTKKSFKSSKEQESYSKDIKTEEEILEEKQRKELMSFLANNIHDPDWGRLGQSIKRIRKEYRRIEKKE
jgi:hypothetical protein